ncbi:LPS export ABC transporter permease LptF [Haemophilus influenzae biotype aegyptius]|uniref:LPS export ABC transporter permease LptF n=1 Tax=Haemophilus influenzae TaxID=727 RepID=UPI0001F36406|nr:LPS export ABC transporter permease LptF [Haemophilus influenzae]QEQ61588.1 LPS export ABC transporter permease LptF [Haemophilus influenzae biotype aegyptius]QEQ62915.1 LPS export ABC transporter permease LptF [Haemophilus influenzae biotype aegyptius]QEQ65148.1 LPS export ABC transporter permease LptF [Haemophilus influenzae biotype aegyptius]TMQ38921.1 LPS export ABC transporter permease LptF [Haemophilus influenzae biotype aegyptius]TMQ39574.1 LPS export ABC transporter permease LptF [H
MILIRYLIKEVFKSQIAILLILLLIFFSQQFVRVLGAAANGNVPADLVFSLLGLGMPTMAQLMLPLCLFIAILLTFGRLYAESEITVMRACGVGQRILVKVALLMSLLTASIATYNALWLSPWAIQKQANIVEDAKANPTMGVLSSGQFISTSNNNVVLFIDQIKDNQIHNVYLFQITPKKQIKPSVVTAEKGELIALPNGDQVLNLKNTQRVEGTSVLPDFRITHFDEYQAYLGHQETENNADEAAELTLVQLIQQDSPAAKAELHWRITLILAVPLMALIAVPLSRVNPRQGRFAKILPALLLYLIYFLLQSSFKSAGGAGKLDTAIFMQLVNIGFLLLGIVLNGWDSTVIYKFRHLFSKKG